jgi:anti-sigma factor ChrR (cupin superfamily)
MHALGVDVEDDVSAVNDMTIEDMLAAEMLLGEMAFVSLATPPPSLRDRLLAQVAAEAAPPPFVLRADDSPWMDTGIPGVRRRNLFLDPETERASFLIQMDPGSKYPPHRHAGVEECFVLQGSVRDDDSSVSTGDYVRYETSSDHSPLVTDAGCLLLIVGSASNQRLG